MASTHEHFMRRALDLAYLAEGRTSPNPIVGAVIVHDGHVVGEGFHRFAGSDHAEVEAIRNAGQATQSSILYVTLEPCNHQGRTPPCTEAIIQAGISRVVFAMHDPNPSVAGGGETRLRDAGVDVTTGILEPDVRFANRAFVRHAQTGRPWVIAKYAASLDGRIATSTGESKWITGTEARTRAHELRSLVDAVMVGAGTVIADDPQLNVRRADAGSRSNGNDPARRQPVRVVLDSHGRVSPDARVFSKDAGTTSILIGTAAFDADLKSRLEVRGTEVVAVRTNGSARVDILEALEALGDRGIKSIMVEGGSELLGSLLAEGLIDEVWAFLAPSLIGGVDAAPALGGPGIPKLADRLELCRVEVERLGGDILVRGVRKDGY